MTIVRFDDYKNDEEEMSDFDYFEMLEEEQEKEREALNKKRQSLTLPDKPLTELIPPPLQPVQARSIQLSPREVKQLRDILELYNDGVLVPIEAEKPSMQSEIMRLASERPNKSRRTFVLPDKVLAMIDGYSERTGIQKSELLAAAIISFFERTDSSNTE